MSRFLTIGHSTRTKEEFLDLCRINNVAAIADVRSMPGSNRCPQFNAEEMASWLGVVGIEYGHFADLGGRWSPKIITPNVAHAVAGWTHRSFQSYAAWTFTPDFMRGVESLLAFQDENADLGATAFMCSEAVPWRCHRQILATMLVSMGFPVDHIMSTSSTKEHNPFEYGATPDLMGNRVTWPKA